MNTIELLHLSNYSLPPPPHNNMIVEKTLEGLNIFGTETITGTMIVYQHQPFMFMLIINCSLPTSGQ